MIKQELTSYIFCSLKISLQYLITEIIKEGKIVSQQEIHT